MRSGLNTPVKASHFSRALSGVHGTTRPSHGAEGGAVMSKKKDDNSLWNVVMRAGVGVVVGTVLGGIVAGPAGAAVGAKIGACCGGGSAS